LYVHDRFLLNALKVVQMKYSNNVEDNSSNLSKIPYGQ